jgi:hypothetical protein
MRILIFLVITLSFVGRVAYADPETKDSGTSVSYQESSSFECSCSLRKQHQTKLRIEKNKLSNFESKEKIRTEPAPNG